MEKKRKLPARASARVEQASKKRHVAVRQRSPSPPVREASLPPQPELPSSIQVGKPLPTVEDPQPDLPLAEFQSISESGVLAESLSRSRQRWTSDGLFEKFWSKPHKRKGVLQEDPGNPPKDSMTRVGTVTLTIEPHIVEATMFAVRAPKPPEPVQPPPHQPSVQPPAPGQQGQPPPPSTSPPARPVLQYGPPTGAMPPTPATPTPTAVTPVSVSQNSQSVASPSTVTDVPRPSPSPGPRQKPEPMSSDEPGQSASSIKVAANVTPSAPRPGPTTVHHATSSGAPVVAAPPVVANQQQGSPSRQAAAPPPASNSQQAATASPAAPQAANRPPAGQPPATPVTAASRPAANDPVIALLAQKASGDSELRDLMKRVAVGQAKEGELAQFQKVIDQLNAECKQRSGPAADRLLVDGRTVKYFADEVRTILDIVLASNPNQKSAELKPPPRSDPLVVLLVKTALEDQRTKDMIRRIADGRPGQTDAQDLKEILDRLHRDAKTVPQGQTSATAPPRPKQLPAANGTINGHVKVANASSPQTANGQALRCKGPPSAAIPARPDITAVVFDFGSGDRFLFPKYSILEYLPTQSGQQVIASFLIVRKGSSSEYGGDPALDYYQPVTIRLSTTNGRYLDNLARVVAPPDEVRRYMDDVMDNMTRAEYVLLAMRLPRAELDPDHGFFAGADEPKTSSSTPKSDPELDKGQPTRPGVLWASTSTKKPLELSEPIKFRDPEQQSQLKYERLIRSIAERETEIAP
ncbi:hypothetical protein CDD80_692 [Ophiocordyceps camponoti-rufipedis]|uniref:SWR1-complex protein 3 domain-containing protein n=1 Tax=Ophiocordyceps camponoti-rufipedis TaxID=2004952 RepID=A0A2C5ZD62_9HYPO|nr:hypothetical protein CDD80_692 [Ophiocordyceps camponoti-rufipedis]